MMEMPIDARTGALRHPPAVNAAAIRRATQTLAATSVRAFELAVDPAERRRLAAVINALNPTGARVYLVTFKTAGQENEMLVRSLNAGMAARRAIELCDEAAMFYLTKLEVADLEAVRAVEGDVFDLHVALAPQV